MGSRTATSVCASGIELRAQPTYSKCPFGADFFYLSEPEYLLYIEALELFLPSGRCSVELTVDKFLDAKRVGTLDLYITYRLVNLEL
jgi:hypothetical protein